MLLQEEARLRVEPAGPHGRAEPGSPGMPPPGMPQGGDAIHADEGDTALTAFPPRRPSIRRAPPSGPDVSLGVLGWLAVLLVAVLLTVLAHAGSVRAGQREHREPSLSADPASVIADPAHVLTDPADVIAG